MGQVGRGCLPSVFSNGRLFWRGAGALIRYRVIKNVAASQDDSNRQDGAGARFSARSVKAQRARLGLSAKDFGRLVGVSALTVHSWESGKSRPRKKRLADFGRPNVLCHVVPHLSDVRVFPMTRTPD